MSKIKVYLDNCTYNRPFDDQRQIRIFLESQAKLHIQHLITTGKILLVCSYMTLYENNDNPYEERLFSIADFLKNASEFVGYDMVEKVELKAVEIMTNHIKNKDAIHIASAIIVGCNYFITTDDDMVKKYSGSDIVICGPVDFIKILEEWDERHRNDNE